MIISGRLQRGLNRIEAAYRGEADRVPVFAQIGAHTIRLAGLNISDFFADPDLFVKTHLAVTDYYRLDAPSFYYDLYNIEAEAMGQRLIWLPGMFPEIASGNMLLQGIDGVGGLKAPDPSRDARMPFVIELYKRVFELGIRPQFRFCAPFSLACNIRGMSGLIMDIVSKPEAVHRLFRFLTDEVLAPWITALRKECGGGFTAVGADALASIPITNLSILEEFAFGYIKRLDELVGGIEVRGWWGEMHLDDPGKLLDLKLRAAPSALFAMDPDVYSLGPGVFKEFAARRKRPLVLGIDCSLISRGPLEALVDRVRQYIDEGGPGGPLLLFMNEVPPDCPPEHVHAVVQAVEHYGRRGHQPEKDFKIIARESFANRPAAQTEPD